MGGWFLSWTRGINWCFLCVSFQLQDIDPERQDSPVDGEEKEVSLFDLLLLSQNIKNEINDHSLVGRS